MFHLAANSSVPHSYSAPGAHLATNVGGTFTMLEEAREAGVRRLVFVSSSEVYGTAQSDLIAEPHPLVAQSPYAASKIAGEKLCESYHRSFGVPVVTVRPFNLYGPRQSRRTVIPSLAAQAVAGGAVKLGRMDTWRDFNYVVDTVEAMIRVAEAPGVDGAVFNIGTGTSVSVRELVETVGELLGRELAVVTAESELRPDTSEVFRLCADPSLLLDVIGDWRTTTLRDGLVRVLDYHRRMPGLIGTHR